ncbi:MAG: tRNA (adenosine(37)-N6)-dimethylallyltransferase MiaA [Rhodobacteraceae bacterium]|jgi:tRNA dimethylallyltransferase|nr:tRNA (adenosine(37)-N6)-dimethylallyltransferase MiaA [Paracoccaceae bacterium]
MSALDGIGRELPVLVAGPTASGKSALALAIAERLGGVIVNADALQVYGCWHVLTARPGPDDLARAPHALYGHVGRDAPHSVGHWLDDVARVLGTGQRPIIVGGTGLYLSALTEGLSAIPPVPSEVRAGADARLARDGLPALVADLDAATAARIDLRNPARVQRAWEVLRATGRGLADWQRDRAPPLLPRAGVRALRLEVPPDVLARRIADRFDAMLATGALDEVRANLGGWDPTRPWARAIGAADLVAYLGGTVPLEDARTRAIVATRQYAKRQRTWFRARMADWTAVPVG